MSQEKIEKELLGKLIKPLDYVGAVHRDLFKNYFGIITVVDWSEEDRELYVEILVGNEFIERKYKSLSMLKRFWNIFET